MSNSTSILPSVLNIVQEKLAVILLPIYVILSVFGNSFCIIYFNRKPQRSSSCAFYLLLTSVTNILLVTFRVTTAILNIWKSVATTSIIYCKLHIYINHVLVMIARMFTVLASFDTYTMSSPNQTCRMFSQSAVAIKCSIAVIFCCPLIAVHMPIMSTIVAGQCVMTGVYTWIFAIYQTLIAGILPPLSMIIFSCLAYFNMKKVGTQHGDISNRTKLQQQRQLVRMVTTQIFVYVISAEPNPITTLYKQLTADVTNKSQDQKAIESFTMFLASTCLLYLNTWTPFFIYYATSLNFRNAFIRLFKKNYQVQPLDN